MVTIAKCADVSQADLLATILRAHGIPTFIPDEMVACLEPPFLYGTGSGVRLQVADADAPAARQLIESKFPDYAKE